MTANRFMRVDNVACEPGVSKYYAYKVVQKLNAELKEKGYLTVLGRINRRFLLEGVCCGGNSNIERQGPDGSL